MCKSLLVIATLAGSFAAWAGDEHYNIPLWENGKVPMTAGDGPLDAPFLTVFMPPGLRLSRSDLGRVEYA